MQIRKIKGNFTVCKVLDYTEVDFSADYCFIGKTDNESSLICLTENAPENTKERVDGWRAFRIEGSLDFSMIGVLAELSRVLAEEKIELLAVSTYDTDYIFVKAEKEAKALSKLGEKGYGVLD